MLPILYPAQRMAILWTWRENVHGPAATYSRLADAPSDSVVDKTSWRASVF